LFGGENLPVGLTTKNYTDSSVQLFPGDRIFLYSDGLTDVMNENQRLFGIDGLTNTIRNTPTDDLEQTLDNVHNAVNAWGNNRPLNDDFTLLAFHIQHDASIPHS